jgi:hypothetical protein
MDMSIENFDGLPTRTPNDTGPRAGSTIEPAPRAYYASQGAL